MPSPHISGRTVLPEDFGVYVEWLLFKDHKANSRFGEKFIQTFDSHDISQKNRLLSEIMEAVGYLKMNDIRLYHELYQKAQSRGSRWVLNYAGGLQMEHTGYASPSYLQTQSFDLPNGKRFVTVDPESFRREEYEREMMMRMSFRAEVTPEQAVSFSRGLNNLPEVKKEGKRKAVRLHCDDEVSLSRKVITKNHITVSLNISEEDE